jgi:hypothetical protein
VATAPRARPELPPGFEGIGEQLVEGLPSVSKLEKQPHINLLSPLTLPVNLSKLPGLPAAPSAPAADSPAPVNLKDLEVRRYSPTNSNKDYEIAWINSVGNKVYRVKDGKLISSELARNSLQDPYFQIPDKKTGTWLLPILNTNKTNYTKLAKEALNATRNEKKTSKGGRRSRRRHHKTSRRTKNKRYTRRR